MPRRECRMFTSTEVCKGVLTQGKVLDWLGPQYWGENETIKIGRSQITKSLKCLELCPEHRVNSHEFQGRNLMRFVLYFCLLILSREPWKKSFTLVSSWPGSRWGAHRSCLGRVDWRTRRQERPHLTSPLPCCWTTAVLLPLTSRVLGEPPSWTHFTASMLVLHAHLLPPLPWLQPHCPPPDTWDCFCLNISFFP